jgi:hypothetical protein
MPDYRLPNKRGIVGQADALLHCMPVDAAGALRCLKPARARNIGLNAALPVAWLFALLVCVSAFFAGRPAAAAGSDQMPGAGFACAPQQAVSGQTSTLLQLAADSLAALVVHLRDTALHEGTEPLPSTIRAQLQGFVPDDILDVARWRTDDRAVLSRSGMLSAMGLVAVTADHVVLFTDAEMALGNPGIWAHELRHVMQYRACGVEGFALAYIINHDALEADARAYSLAWHQWTLDRWLEQVMASDRDLPN